MKKIKVEAMVLGNVGTNCYVISNIETKETVIVDPADEANHISDCLKREGLHLKAILLTHGHFDHIMAVQELFRTYQVPVYCHESEQEVLQNPRLNLSGMIGANYAIQATNLVKDQEIIELISTKIQVIATPGHTIGGACYYFVEEGCMFVGDTIFFESIGRTDFPSGNGEILIRSIKEKLFILPDDICLYPGHGPATSIGYEKENNPFI